MASPYLIIFLLFETTYLITVGWQLFNAKDNFASDFRWFSMQMGDCLHFMRLQGVLRKIVYKGTVHNKMLKRKLRGYYYDCNYPSKSTVRSSGGRGTTLPDRASCHWLAPGLFSFKYQSISCINICII